jgi:hypothetical protein
MKYLDCEGDLMNISTSTTHDDALERLEGVAGEGICWAIKGFRAVSEGHLSNILSCLLKVLVNRPRRCSANSCVGVVLETEFRCLARPECVRL